MHAKTDHRNVQRYTLTGRWSNGSLSSWAIYTPSTRPFDDAGVCRSSLEIKTHQEHIQATKSAEVIIQSLAQA